MKLAISLVFAVACSFWPCLETSAFAPTKSRRNARLTTLADSTEYRNVGKEIDSYELEDFLADSVTPAVKALARKKRAVISRRHSVVNPSLWLTRLYRTAAPVYWTFAGVVTASLIYTGHTRRRLGFRYEMNVAGSIYSGSFSTTTDPPEDDTFVGSESVVGAKYTLKNSDTGEDWPYFYVTVIDYNMRDDVIVAHIVDGDGVINKRLACPLVEQTIPSAKGVVTNPSNQLTAKFKTDLEGHKEHCKLNMVQQTEAVSATDLTKQIDTALAKGSMHIQQVKDFVSDVEDEVEETRLRKESSARVKDASVYLVEFTRHMLANMIELKTEENVQIFGEYINITGNIANDYAKVGFPTFAEYTQDLPVGYMSVVTESNFNKQIDATSVTSTLVSAVVDSLGIVNNPLFTTEVQARLAATIDNLLEIVKENRSENIETRLFTVTPLTRVQFGDVLVSIKLAEFTMSANTWSDVFDGCNVRTMNKGAKLEYSLREMTYECESSLLESAAEVINESLKDAIAAYDNSDIPDNIDIETL